MLSLPEIGFGCWAIGGHGYGEVDDATSEMALCAAWDEGVRLFDTANVYGLGRSETVVGRALAGKLEREDSLLATKGGVTWDERGRTGKDCSPAGLRSALEGSLRRLGVDCIPLYQVHWHDGRTPPEDIIEAMLTFRDEGKIRWIGCSNFDRGLIGDDPGSSGYNTIQLSFSLLNRQNEALIKECHASGMQTIVYDVLARGLLADKFSADTIWSPNDTRAADPLFQGQAFESALAFAGRLRRLGEEIGQEPASVALRWTVQHPAVSTVIVGCKTVDQLQKNVAVRDWRLDSEQMRAIDKLSAGMIGAGTG